MRVVFCVLDGFPLRHATVQHAPTIASLTRSGGSAVDGGRAVLTSATYPNHASFVTGTTPARHGLWANRVPIAEALLPADEVGPVGPTMFEVMADRGIGSEAVVGDHHLLGVCRLTGATRHWPPNGVRPDGAPLDALGYLSDDVTVEEQLAAIERDAPFLFLHLNEPDTAGHIHGPDSPAAAEVYTATDARLGRLVDALQTNWSDTVLVIVSDHDMVAVEGLPIDLKAAAVSMRAGVTVVHEGSGALVFGGDASWARDVDGVSDVRRLAPEISLVDGQPGRWFGARKAAEAAPRLPAGMHGGTNTVRQLAVVAGGHEIVGALAAAVAADAPDAEDWAVTIAMMFGVQIDGATGRNLLVSAATG